MSALFVVKETIVMLLVRKKLSIKVNMEQFVWKNLYEQMVLLIKHEQKLNNVRHQQEQHILKEQHIFKERGGKFTL